MVFRVRLIAEGKIKLTREGTMSRDNHGKVRMPPNGDQLQQAYGSNSVSVVLVNRLDTYIHLVIRFGTVEASISRNTWHRSNMDLRNPDGPTQPIYSFRFKLVRGKFPIDEVLPNIDMLAGNQFSRLRAEVIIIPIIVKFSQAGSLLQAGREAIEEHENGCGEHRER